MPANRHNQGACLSFADGHVERWKWRVPMLYADSFEFVGVDQMPDYMRIEYAMKQRTDN
jgi:prepilin-type processing-associated H-X9-DG protein